MSDFLDDLELSVRSSNALRNQGVNDLATFMALTKETVLSWKNVGVRTWSEVEEIQRYLKRIEKKDDLLERALNHIRDARILLQQVDPTGERLRLVLEEEGPVIYRRLR